MAVIFDIPRGEIFRIDTLDVRLVPEPHPFLAGRAREVAERWAAEKAANPALFDGEVVLLSRLVYRDGCLEGVCHTVRYSEFLYWRSLRPVASAEHVYAHAVLVAADNALLAIRMAGHTFNAGLVYFAAGSFEPVDFPGGRLDSEFNMRREVMEETGLDLGLCRAEPAMLGLSLPNGTVFFRRYVADAPADELAAAISRHIRDGVDDEIEAPVIIRSPEEAPDRLAPQMPALISWHFSTPLLSGG
jgi:8-oxo-dGTP pyrophosphatase MutT (NUDIX family)